MIIKSAYVGDSIANGWRNNSKGFVGDLNIPYKNISLSGASLSTKVTSITNIPTQLENETDYEPDIVIADGGVNDYLRHAPLGDLPINVITSKSESNNLNLDTVLGGLQKLFWLMINKYPKAQRFFLITHKITAELSSGAEKVDWSITKNDAGYSFDELHDAIIKVCELYNVKVIDVYKEGIINTAFDCYVSKISYSIDSSVTNTEFVDSDGIHPLAYGYRHGYVPLVREALKIGTTK